MCGETCLINHVTLWMPALVSVIPVDLDILLQYGTVAAWALCCIAGRVVEMTVYITIVLVVGILGAKNGSAKGTCKVLDMVFLICSQSSYALRSQRERRQTGSGDVTAPQCCPTLCTDKVETSEVVTFA